MSCIVLYERPDCSLCDDARAALDELGHPYRSATDPSYADRAPVVVVDGAEVAVGTIRPWVLKRAIKKAQRRR